MKLKVACTLLLLACAGFCRAQNDSVFTVTISARAHAGVLLPEYGFINYYSDAYLHGAEISIRQQRHGKSFWDMIYHYPSWGLSLYYGTLGNRNVFGSEFSLFPYFSLRIIERKKFFFNWQMGTGITWATRKFDLADNYENLAIGSHLNIHYHADLVTAFRCSERTWMNAGLSFNHLSNANLSEPNVGLNCTTVFAGLQFATGSCVRREYPVIPPLEPAHHFDLMLNGGARHTRTFESFRYPVFSFSAEYGFRKKYKFGFGGGADLFWDSSIETQMEKLGLPYSKGADLQTGVHATASFYYDKFSLLIQQGVYIGFTDKLNHHPVYDRIMMNYHLTEQFAVSFSMKSYLYILDFPELGIGYTLF